MVTLNNQMVSDLSKLFVFRYKNKMFFTPYYDKYLEWQETHSNDVLVFYNTVIAKILKETQFEVDKLIIFLRELYSICESSLDVCTEDTTLSDIEAIKNAIKIHISTFEKSFINSGGKILPRMKR